MNKSDSIKSLAIAMNKAQAEMGGASKGKTNPFFKQKYADLGSVVQAVKEPFTNNGLSYVQFPIEEGGRIGIETILMHESGEWLSNSFTVQLTKQDAQGAGSAITYCRRYSLQSIAGIPSEDDDGNAASKGQATTIKVTANPYDIAIIKDLIDKKDVKGVKYNWGELISKNWKSLSAIQTEDLNNLYNQEG